MKPGDRIRNKGGASFSNGMREVTIKGIEKQGIVRVVRILETNTTTPISCVEVVPQSEPEYGDWVVTATLPDGKQLGHRDPKEKTLRSYAWLGGKHINLTVTEKVGVVNWDTLTVEVVK